MARWPIRHIFSPLIEVDFRNQSSRALLIARSDDLVKQMRGLRRFQAFDTVKSPFINDQELWTVIKPEQLR